MTALAPPLLVGAGGAVGALLRYSVVRIVDVDGYPLGTLTVNVVGTFALGLVAFAGADRGLFLLFGTGVCGSFTTFSSFSVDTVRLWESGYRRRAAANALGNLAGAGLALAVAWLAVRLVLG